MGERRTIWLKDGVDPARLSYLTADEPGVGGKLKVRPEDFTVEELPLYEPSGQGDHLYLMVEKRRRLTTDVVRYLSRHFHVSRYAIGYAGLKDKHAITRQAFTLEHAKEDLAATFHDEYIRIIGVSRHNHKLKRGHLRGNRFIVKIREVEPTHVIHAQRIMQRLTGHGAPNFIGEQRFGYRFNNHLLGLHLLRGRWQEFLDEMLGRPGDHDPPRVTEARQAYEQGDYKLALSLWPTVHRFERQAVGPLSRGAPPADAVNGIDKTQRLLLISALQSVMFNRVLDRRIRAGMFEKVLAGDVMFRNDNRRWFRVTDVEAEQDRYDRQEIAPTGPMWGRKMMRTADEVDQWESESLTEAGLSESDFKEGEYTPNGSRRPLCMPVKDVEVAGGGDEFGPYIRVSFELPRGCFATTIMREVMKGSSTRQSVDSSTESAD